MTNHTGIAAGKPSVRRATLQLSLAIVTTLAAMFVARAQDANEANPSMAPLDQYLMKREAEIALARSAAPKSIALDADVMVPGRAAYETAVKGTNGFVGLVQRSWAVATDDPEFWKPGLRAPVCFSQPAVRSYLPQITQKTDWALAGRSKAQMYEDIKSAIARKVLPTREIGANCYTMSKQGYLNDHDGHWYPHLMFFVPLTAPPTWGAGLPGPPILGVRTGQAG